MVNFASRGRTGRRITNLMDRLPTTGVRKSIAMKIKGLKIAGLKATPLTPVPGVVSPINQNTAKPSKVGSQAVVKQAKPKKPGQATDKPSQFYKSEDFKGIKHPSVEKLRAFLEKHRSKKRVLT